MYHHHNYANAPPITHHIPDRHLNTSFHCREDTAENVQESVRLPLAARAHSSTIAPTPSHIQSENYVNPSSLRILLQAACDDDTLPSGEPGARIERHGIGDFFGLTQAL